MSNVETSRVTIKLFILKDLLGEVASPCDAHHHGDNDGDLHGADDGGDEHVVQLLSTGNHVEDVEVLRLVALRTFVTCVTSGTREVV